MRFDLGLGDDTVYATHPGDARPTPACAPAPASLQMMGRGDAWPAPATEPTPTPSTKFPLVKFPLAGASTESSEEEEAAADDPFGWVGNTWNDTVKAVGSMIGGTPNPSSVDSADVRRVDPNRIVH